MQKRRIWKNRLVALIILQKSTFLDTHDPAPKMWFGRAACTKPHRLPIPIQYAAEGRTSHPGALPSFLFARPPFLPILSGRGGRFHVRQTGAGPVWGLAVLLCGGGLPPVLALLRHDLWGPGGGAERGHPPPAARRGNFYDYRGQLLTGQTTRWMALCVPGEGSYARLFAYTDAAGQAALYQKRNAASPFLLEVDRDVSALGVSCWPAARRSSAAPLAVQLLGYLDGEGMVLPVWKPPLTNCSPAAGRGIPCSAPSTPRESCGPSPSSPPPTAVLWGCS